MGADYGLVEALRGRIVPSEVDPRVTYRLVGPLGEGGMAVAFYSVREAPEGATPAVLKVVRPEIVGTSGETAFLMIQKEAIALGRLNERVPPTPFVVRFLDTGKVALPTLQGLVLPWIAIEHVYGGTEGTTLEQRVLFSVAHTRFAFDPARAAHNVECLAEGLSAIHEVGVFHRDLTPGNILCCGFGSGEVPKIADFGIARPSGINVTFGSVLLGTPGYAAPEQSFASEGDVGPWTDVFSFACLVFFMLTGEQYFETRNFAHALMLLRDPKRRSLLEARGLSPELADNRVACRALDFALARATALAPGERTPDARFFASGIVPSLRAATSGPRSSQRASERLVASLAEARAAAHLAGWSWTIRHPPGDDRLVRSVAWDGDGHCLAVTTDGLAYWNGTTWLTARTDGLPASARPNSVSVVRPGQFLIGGADGLLTVLCSDGPARTIALPAGMEVALASGDPDDLALVVVEPPGHAPLLLTLAAGRCFRPVHIESARTIASISRLDDSSWLVAGRTEQGGGFVAVHSALTFETAFLFAPPTDAFTASATQADRGVGLASGRRGATVRYGGDRVDSATVDGAPDLASAAIDVQGTSWVGASGRLYFRASGHDARWTLAWDNSSFRAPFVSLRADPGVVTAVTVDGAILEGRAPSGF